jgi:hypothetical protein
MNNMTILPTFSYLYTVPTDRFDIGGPTITVEVGNKRTKYYVHKALLVHHSTWFDTAIRGLSDPANEAV